MLSDQSNCDLEVTACASNTVELPVTGEGDSKQNNPPPGSRGHLPDPEGEFSCPNSASCDPDLDRSCTEAIDLQSPSEIDGKSTDETIQCDDSLQVNEACSRSNATADSSLVDCISDGSSATIQMESNENNNYSEAFRENGHSVTKENFSINDESREAASFVVEGCLQKVFGETGLAPILTEAKEPACLENETTAPVDQSDQGSVDMDVDPSPPEGTIATTIYSSVIVEPSVSDKHDLAPSEQQIVSSSGSKPAIAKAAGPSPASDAKNRSPATKKKGNDARPASGRRRSPPRARSPFRRVRRSPFRGPRSPPRGRRSPPRRRSPLRYRSLSPRRRDRALEPGDATCQIICLGTAQSRYTAYCMDQIHAVGISCSMRYLDQQSLSAVMGAVVHSHARYVIIIGKENELKGTVNFKVLSDKERKSVATTIENAISIMVERERPLLERDRLSRSPYPSDYHARDPRSMRHDDYDTYAPRYLEHDRYTPDPDRYTVELDRYTPEPDRYPADRMGYERDPYAYPVSVPPAAPASSMYSGRSRDYSPPRENYSRYMPPLSAGTYSPPRDLGNLQHSRYQPVLPSQSDGYSRYSSQAYGGYDLRSTPIAAASSSSYDPYAAVSPRMPPSRLGGTTSYAGPPRSQYDQAYDYQY